MVLFAFHDQFNLFELHKFVNRLEANLGVFLDGLEVDHFVHVVR